ncbi:MAG TPA: hypothetical protein VNS46_07515 [Nocardioides sp.]|nr:hypothetical protein [Nocardioides sp.]
MKTTTTTTARTALRLLVATPIAVSAIAFGSGVAHADGGFEPNGPIVIAQPDEDGPKGPGDIANPEPSPEPDPAPKPQGPGDIANPEGDDDPKPEGPDDLAIPEPGDKPEDEPADVPAKDVDVHNSGDVDQVDGVTEDVPVPTRIDAGAGSTTEDEQGMELMWVLVGGGVVTAAGSVLARQRLARRTR